MNPYEWRIEEIERNAKRAVDSLWKLDALSGRVDSLESALRESRSEADGLRSELRSTQDRLQQLEYRVEEMANEKACPGCMTRVTCEWCGGKGTLDSGGVTPWGAEIQLPCPHCTAKASRKNFLKLEFAYTAEDLSDPMSSSDIAIENIWLNERLIDQNQLRLVERLGEAFIAKLRGTLPKDWNV